MYRERCLYRGVYIERELYICIERGVYIEVYIEREVYMYRERCIYIEREVYIYRERCIYKYICIEGYHLNDALVLLRDGRGETHVAH
jgi:hypothetical protein